MNAQIRKECFYENFNYFYAISTFSRLNIFLAVLQDAMFHGKFITLQKMFKRESKDLFRSDIDDIRKILEEASNVLKYEIGSKTGEKMNEIICLNKVKFMGWLKDNGMIDT